MIKAQVNDKVWCGGDSGFCDSSIETVKEISYKYDENTGVQYSVIHLQGGRKFDSRNGLAINPPMAYYIVDI